MVKPSFLSISHVFFWHLKTTISQQHFSMVIHPAGPSGHLVDAELLVLPSLQPAHREGSQGGQGLVKVPRKSKIQGI